MWNHAPAMEIHMRELKMPWPRFEGEEMNDLLAFVRQERAGPERESDLLPANPRRGWAYSNKRGASPATPSAAKEGLSARTSARIARCPAR